MVAAGHLNGPGSTRDPDGVNFGIGLGVHVWGSGLTRDFVGQNGNSAIMQASGSPNAYWVRGAIWTAYLGQGATSSGPGWMGYPLSDEFPDGGWTRSNFVNGFICWAGGTTLVRGYEWLSCTSPWPGNPPVNTLFYAIQGSHVWLMRSDGLKHHVPNPATLNCWLWTGPVVSHSPPYVDAIPLGPALEDHEGCAYENFLLQDLQPGSPNQNKVYVMQGGLKRWVPNPVTLNCWSWAGPVYGFTNGYAGTLQTGVNLQDREGCNFSNLPPANGELFYGIGANPQKVYVFQNGLKRWIPYPAWLTTCYTGTVYGY